MKIFILEDDPQRIVLFREACIGHDLTLAANLSQAYGQFRLGQPYDVMCLDHDLGGMQMVDSFGDEETGYVFCLQLIKNEMPFLVKGGCIFIHSYNPDGAKNMLRVLVESSWPAMLLPFGPTLLGFLKGLK